MAKIKARGATEVARFEKRWKDADGIVRTTTLVLTSDGRVLRKSSWWSESTEVLPGLKGKGHFSVMRKIPLCERGVWLDRVRSTPGWKETTKS